MRRPHCSIFTLFCCNLLSFTALAQETPIVATVKQQEVKAVKHVEDKTQKVEVKSKSEAIIANSDAMSRMVVSNAELSRFGDNGIIDAMKRVPGLQVTNNKLHLVGMDANYTQILVDGEPPRGINIEDIPMNRIERVEIYRGANAQFSTQAMAGTINIILKRASSTAQQMLKVGLSKVFRDGENMEWMKSDKLNELSYSLSIAANQRLFASKYDVDRDTEILIYDDNNQVIQHYTKHGQRHSNDQNFRISPRIQYKTESGINLTSNSFLNYSKNKIDNQARLNFLLGAPEPIGFSQSHDENERFAANTNLRALMTLGEDIKLDANIGLNASISKSFSFQNNLDSQNKPSYHRYIQSQNRVQGISSSGKISIPSNEEHDIVTGWSVSSAFSNGTRNQTMFEADNPNAIYDPQQTHARIDKYALFAQDEWKFKKNSSVYLGVRWEGVRLASEGTVQQALSHRYSVISPILQSLWQLNSENTDRIRFGLSRTYQAPLDFVLVSPKFYVVNNSILNPNYIGNPNLRPELAWGLDAAYEHNGKDDWNYSVRAKIQNISDLHRDPVFFKDNAWWRQHINMGGALRQSLELNTQFPLKRFIDGAPNMDFTLGYSRHWSNIKGLPKPNNQLTPYTYQLTVGIDYRAQLIPLSTGLNVQKSDSHWMQSDLITSNYSNSPVNVDVYFMWKFDKKNQLRLSINNLTNTQSFAFQTLSKVPGRRSFESTGSKPYREFNLNFEHTF